MLWKPCEADEGGVKMTTYWMFIRLMILATAFSPTLVLGQSVEEENSETIAAPSRPSESSKSPNVSDTAKLIVQKTNDLRQEEGLPTVELNAQLSETARYFAEYMAKTNKYGHTADGKRPFQRATQFGYDYCIVTENIAYQYNSEGFSTGELAEQFFQGWAHSPGHRKNMLDPGRGRNRSGGGPEQ